MAYNAAGASAISASFSATIGLFPDPPPAAPQIVLSTPASISFKWNASSNANGASLTSYVIYSNDVSAGTVQGNILTYTLTTGITAGSSYKIQIASVNTIGEGAKSQSNVFYAVDIPPAPVLSITDSQTDSCTVSWTSVTAPVNSVITGYLVQNDIMTGLGYLTGCDYTSNPGQLSCKISNLQTGKKVAIKAQAFNKGGQSADSIVVYCVPVGKPGQPGTPRLVSSSAISITVAWDGASSTGGLPITSYRLFSDEEETSPLASVENWVQVYDGASLTATQNTGLTAGKSYRFRVQAINSANQGLFSNIASYMAASVPNTPTSFTATSSSRTWLYLTWAKPTLIAGTDPAVVGYILATNYGSNPAFSTISNITSGDQLFYNVTGQPTGSTYRFKLLGYNLVGSSSYTSELSATFADSPSKMQIPFYVSSTKTTVTTATITIGWNPVSDPGGVPVTGYKLYYLDTVTSTGGILYDGSANPSVLQYSATGLNLGRKYRFYVSALNPKEGPVSDIVELFAAGLPAKITAITEVANSRTETCIGLTWTAPDDGGSSIILYEVATSDGVLRYSGTTTQAYVCGLNTGMKYWFTVQAISSAGRGTISDAFPFTIAGTPSTPRYVRSGSTTSTTQISLIWEVPTSIGGAALTGYKIYRKLTNTAGSLSILATIDPSLVTYTDATVTSGTSYTYAVTATNAFGESTTSSTVDIIPMSVPAAPAAPTLVSKDRYSIRVVWNVPSNIGGSSISSYKLYMKRQTDTDYSLVFTGTSTDYLAAGLTSGVLYYFKISAINAAGEGPASDPSTGILTADKPSAPSNLRVTSRSSGAITIQWDLPSDTGGAPLVGYVVESAVGSGTYSEVTFAGNSNPGINYLAQTGLTACTAYTYRVYSVNQDGRSLPSTPVTAYAASIPVAPTIAPTVSGLTKYSMSITMTALTGTDTGGCPITYYKVYTSVNGNSYIEAGSTTLTTLVLTNLQVSAVYQIKYAASNRVYDEGNNFGVSLLMSPVTTVTVAVVPLSPDNFKKGSISYRDQVYVEWTPPSDTGGSAITGYTLQVVDVAASTSSNSNIASSSTSYTVSGLTPGKTYTLRLATVTAIGTSSWTSDLTVIPGLLPTKPAGLAIGSKTRSSFTASWTALIAEDTGGTAANPIAITSYQLILRDVTSGLQTTFVTASVSYILTYLTPGLTYGVKVRGCTAIGCSDYSSEVKDVAGLVPGIPGTITIQKQSDSSIELSWLEPTDDGGSPITGYQVGITVSGVETVKTGIYTRYYKYTTSDGIAAGNTYLIRVAAQNSNGYGGWTNQVTAYSSNLPSTVSGLTSSSVTQYSGQINWVLLSTVAAKGYSTANPTYTLESASCLDDIYSSIFTTTSATSYALSGITPGACMHFRMKVTNNLGDSSYCSTLEVLFAAVPSAPSTPTIVSRNSTTTDGTHIKVSWTAPTSNGGAAILGYILEQYSGTTWSTIYDGSSNPSLLTYTAQSLTPGQTYKYRVTARNLAGLSSTSAELTAIAGTVPGKITNLRVSSKVVSGSTSQLVLAWDIGTTGGSAITNFYLKYRVNSSTSTDAITTTGSTTATYTLTNLYAGVVYAISVAATNTVYDTNNVEGLSLIYSDTLTTVVANAPSKMTLAQASSTNINQVILTWSAPSDGGSIITGYTLKRDNGAGVYYTVYSGMSTSYTDNSVIGGNSYIYTIYASNAAGAGTISDAFTAKAGTKPGAVKNLKATTQSSTSLVISWSAPDSTGGYAITRYWVYQDSGDMVYLAGVDNVLATTYTKTIIAGQIGMRFRFKIAAENSIGIGDNSVELALVAANTPDPPAITVNDSSRTLTSASVTWTQPSVNGGSQIIGYILRRDDGIAGSAFSVVYNGTNSPQVLSYTLTGLTTGLSYTLRLVSVNSVGESSTYTSLTLIPGIKPSKIEKVTVVSSAFAGKIKITWTAPTSTGGTALTKYRLYIAEVGTSFGAPTDYTNLALLEYEFTSNIHSLFARFNRRKDISNCSLLCKRNR